MIKPSKKSPRSQQLSEQVIIITGATDRVSEAMLALAAAEGGQARVMRRPTNTTLKTAALVVAGVGILTALGVGLGYFRSGFQRKSTGIPENVVHH